MTSSNSQTSNSYDWYRTATGQLAIQQIRAELMPYINSYPKKTVLQLGCINLLQHLPKHPVSHSYTICKNPIRLDFISVYGNYSQLPIADDTIDLAILPHLFDSETDIKNILSECWRVISQRGHLIIVGINPWSLWGLAYLFASRHFPSSLFQHLTSAQKICHYLRDLESELVLSKTFCYKLPTNKAPQPKNQQWLEKFGQLTFPYTGGLYLIIAKKRIISPTLIKPRWSWEQMLTSKNYTEPTTSGARHG